MDVGLPVLLLSLNFVSIEIPGFTCNQTLGVAAPSAIEGLADNEMLRARHAPGRVPITWMGFICRS
jgi:hypothetical protein